MRYSHACGAYRETPDRNCVYITQSRVCVCVQYSFASATLYTELRYLFNINANDIYEYL